MSEEDLERLFESINSLEGVALSQLILLARLYDLLVVSNSSNEDIAKVVEMHELGLTLTNSPFLNEESVKRWNGE